MAKQAKDQMTVKGALATYKITWEFSTPISEWSRDTLLANLRVGLRYAITRKISTATLAAEQNMNRHQKMIKFMTDQTQGDPEKLAKMWEFCRMEKIEVEVPLHYKFTEADFTAELDSDDADESEEK